MKMKLIHWLMRYTFLRRTSEEDKSLVPTWSEVAQEYIRKLYGGQV
jgi:hypothetical protein